MRRNLNSVTVEVKVLRLADLINKAVAKRKIPKSRLIDTQFPPRVSKVLS